MRRQLQSVLLVCFISVVFSTFVSAQIEEIIVTAQKRAEVSTRCRSDNLSISRRQLSRTHGRHPGWID